MPVAALHSSVQYTRSAGQRAVSASVSGVQVVHGAKKVVSVDCNPAQTALLELKALAIERLPYEDVWQLFGEGRHPHFHRLFLTKLGPFMSEKSYRFWQQRCA
jgi:S-adenosylmethionine:diacylglycerol 3-amino-3-carboxypropyl transferase